MRAHPSRRGSLGRRVARASGGLLAALLLLSVAPLLADEGEPDQPASPQAASPEVATPELRREQIEGWLEDLRSPAFAVREAARKGLDLHGHAAPDLLEARRDDPDPEVRRTVRVLLERIQSPRPPRSTVPSGDPALLGRVTLDARGTLPFLLDLVGQGHGATFVLPEVPEGLTDVIHSLQLADAPFFDALAQLTSKAQLRAPSAFDPGGRLVLESALTAVDVPWSAAGPMRARVVEVTSVRSLAATGGRRYMVAVDLEWIPSVHLRQWGSPRDIEAADAEGRTYRAGSAMRSNVSYGTSLGSRHARLALHLEPDEAEEGERLETLSFTLPVTLYHGREHVVLGPLADLSYPVVRRVSGPTGSAHEGDEVTLRAVTRPTVEREPWAVEVLARLTGKAAQQSLTVSLGLESGQVRAASAGSRLPSADGTLAFRARAWIREPDVPVSVHVAFFREDLQGTVRFTLRDVPLR